MGDSTAQSSCSAPSRQTLPLVPTSSHPHGTPDYHRSPALRSSLTYFNYNGLNSKLLPVA